MLSGWFLCCYRLKLYSSPAFIFSLSLFLSPFFLSLFSVFIFTAAAVGDNEDDDASLGWANFNYASA